MRLPLLHVFVGLSTLISVQANYTASKTECDGFGSVKDISFVAGGPPQPDFHSKKNDRSRAIQFKEGPGKDVWLEPDDSYHLVMSPSGDAMFFINSGILYRINMATPEHFTEIIVGNSDTEWECYSDWKCDKKPDYVEDDYDTCQYMPYDGIGTRGGGLHSNMWMAISPDGNTVYLSDYSCCIVRQVDVATRELKTIAGTADWCDHEDGPYNHGYYYEANKLDEPSGIAVSKDGKKLYIASYGNGRLRELDLDTGYLRSMTPGYMGWYKDDYDHTLRDINMDDYTRTIWNGGLDEDGGYWTTNHGEVEYHDDVSEMDYHEDSGMVLSPDGETLYIAVYNYGVIYSHHIPTENQRLVAFDLWGDNGADGIGSDAAYDEYEHWHGISISPDGKTIYMGGTWQQNIRAIDIETSRVTTIVGYPITDSDNEGYNCDVCYRDGPAKQALIEYPGGTAISPDGKKLYVFCEDAFYYRDSMTIREVDLDTSQMEVRTIVGMPQFQTDGSGIHVDLRKAQSSVASPDGKTLYVYSECFISAIDLTSPDHHVTHIAGGHEMVSDDYECGNGNYPEDGNTDEYRDGVGTHATFLASESNDNHCGLAITPDGKTLYVSQYSDSSSVIRKVDLATRRVSTIKDLSQITDRYSHVMEEWVHEIVDIRPSQMAVSPDGKTLYIANQRSRQPDLAIDLKSLLHTFLDRPHNIDMLKHYEFEYLNDRRMLDEEHKTFPMPDIWKLFMTFGAPFDEAASTAVSPDGRFVYFASYYYIWQVEVETNHASYIAGVNKQAAPGYQNGLGDVATFNGIHGLAVSPDGEFLYVADRYNWAVRQIELATSMVSTLASAPYYDSSPPPLWGGGPNRRSNEDLREYWFYKDPNNMRPSSISVSPDGSQLFVTDDFLWDWYDDRRDNMFRNERTLSEFSVRKITLNKSCREVYEPCMQNAPSPFTRCAWGNVTVEQARKQQLRCPQCVTEFNITGQGRGLHRWGENPTYKNCTQPEQGGRPQRGAWKMPGNTGGTLGQFQEEGHFESYVCLGKHKCAGNDTHFCFVFDKMNKTYVPWAPIGHIGLQRQCHS